MASANQIKVRMVSTGTTKDGKKTGYFYTTTKNKRNAEKIILKKFDPRAYNKAKDKTGMHVEFKEEKMK